ncbi:ABC transporter ATP-binding protein [Kribbella sp. NPDC026611]|uniref:ABC transporter ATP-binding protein n=1 Tax=Kribbella sp. NPDC026611 TaxID=3154911 RepID=UPI00340347B8
MSVTIDPGLEIVRAASPSDGTAVRVERITRIYDAGGQPVVALDGVDATFASGTFTAVMGASGSGKSTLLQTAAGLERPTSGRVWIGAHELSRLSEAALTRLRRNEIGFVFQQFNLVGALTVEENITLPLRLSGVRPDRRWLAEIVERVGVADRLHHRPVELSGGQQQRVAIARALAIRPTVVFADEPTAALDSQTAADVLALLRSIVDDHDQTIIMVTHDPLTASYADRMLALADGRIVADSPSTLAGGAA